MRRDESTRGVRLYSAAFLLLMAAPCQETNPDFDGAEGSAEGTTTQSATDTGTADTGPSTMPGSGSGDGTTMTVDTTAAPETTTGPPPDTTSTGDSMGDSTTGCAGMICEGECVDVMTNPDHCGMCGDNCNPQQVCVDGDCVMN